MGSLLFWNRCSIVIHANGLAIRTFPMDEYVSALIQKRLQFVLGIKMNVRLTWLLIIELASPIVARIETVRKMSTIDLSSAKDDFVFTLAAHEFFALVGIEG